MTPAALLDRMLAAGFTFSLATDGSASFHRPDGDSPEADALLSLVAWRWSELEQPVREYLATTQMEIPR